MVACSAMAAAKEEDKSQSTSPRSRWQKWRRGGIIGAAALTGGTLMAISGGDDMLHAFKINLHEVSPRSAEVVG